MSFNQNYLILMQELFKPSDKLLWVAERFHFCAKELKKGYEKGESTAIELFLQTVTK